MTLSNKLKSNEIWLEGQEVSKTEYLLLYCIYGNTYGTPTNKNNFVLPDFRNRSIWSVSKSDSLGYEEGSIPNITGTTRHAYTNEDPSGSLYTIQKWKGESVPHIYKDAKGPGIRVGLDASLSSKLYKNNVDKNIPTSIRVRVKTRFI